MNKSKTVSIQQKSIKGDGLLASVTRIIHRLRPHIQSERTLLIIAAVALLASVLFRILEPWPLKFIFDSVLVSGEDGSLQINKSNQLSLLIAALAASVVVIAILQAGASYLSKYAMAVASSRILGKVRSDLYTHLQKLSLSFYDRFGTGDLANRLTADIEKLRLVSTNVALALISNIITMFGMLIVMFWINWQLAALAIIFLPMFYLLGRKMTNLIRNTTKSHRKSEGILASTAVETMNSIKAVKAHALHDSLDDVFKDQSNYNLEMGTTTTRLSAMLYRSISILFAFCLALVLWSGSYFVLNQTITPGELVVFIAYLRSALQKPTTKLTRQIVQITQAAISGERVLDVLDYEPPVRERSGAVTAPILHGCVEFQNVSLAYDSNKTVLHDISFRVEAGQHVVLVGPSGSGKSSLLSLLLRLYEPTAGRIVVDEHDIRDYKLTSYRNQLSVVLQESALFGTSIRDNVAYGSPGASDIEIENALRTADAWEFVNDLPEGINTLLSEGATALSGLQRQRLAIARAAIRGAPIVLLDEATTGLDKTSELEVNKALLRLTNGRTSFTVSHDPTTITHADLIIFLSAGRVMELGSHEELISINGHYARLYNSQISLLSTENRRHLIQV